VTVGPIGLTRPEWVRPIFVAWMALAFPIGWTVSRAVLALVYYGLFTPLGLVFRLLGRDPLRRTRTPASGLSSYWSRKPGVSDPVRYLQQF
jgi:hypothetical protein